MHIIDQPEAVRPPEVYKRPFTYDPPTEPRLDIVHEDEMIVVCNKPVGLLTVPGRGDDFSDCLSARVQGWHPSATIVHRLDLDTSGVIVFALTRNAHRHIGQQFEKRRTRKRYIARVAGKVEPKKGRIDWPLLCDWPNRPRQMVEFENGRAAITDWKVLAHEDGATRVELTPLTGRSHQLRVHMASMGHPILGDPLYADDEAFAAADRLQLHAEMLGFRHPDGGAPVSFEVPVPF